ncbi:MAG TPA: outer membrane protein assembly factor BamD [Candidatus Angelobacter sp.]|jgi:outer membrane protein assembly factor BamD|nr:outer membrane protein assembly factor BamD [Candidatus Angelobacter sp.]
MVRKIIISGVLALAVLAASGCNHKVQNPLSNIDSKQPDKALFDRSMDAMKKAHYQEARTLLETLINTYPDSEYIARAKLSLGDAWYNEGGKAAWAQAEVEYKDFQTFFPNLPEASEAQLKIASMHYREMEKPDRDYVETQRAAEEYKAMIQQYPDSPLVPQAKQKLREVQEMLAERQFRIASFYYMRQNLAASQARLVSLTENYPLYSGSDEALFLLGAGYEKEALGIDKQKIPDAQKEKLVAQFQQKAIDAYSRIVTRYGATPRVGDAKRRLAAMNAPIPVPTPEALAQSKAEVASQQRLGMIDSVTANFKKHPSVLGAYKVGEPNLQDEKVESAPEMVKSLTNQLNALPAGSGPNIGIQAVSSGTGTPGANEKAPGSPATTEPAADGTAPTPAPAQVNEIQKAAAPAATDGTAPAADGQAAPAATTTAPPADPKQESSSKKKGKKGLKKLIPF